ncbi:MAG: histidine kinase dimerization/phospho-acceptor domain-containing protein [Sedimenticola sp.]
MAPMLLSREKPLIRFLLKHAIAVYVLVVVMVTAGQIAIEVSQAQKDIIRELEVEYLAVKPSLAYALWSVNETSISTILKGMVHSPSITGVEVKDARGVVLAENPPTTKVDFAYQDELFYEGRNVAESVGSVTIYSNMEVVYARLETGWWMLGLATIAQMVIIILFFMWVFGRLRSTEGSLRQSLRETRQYRIALDNVSAYIYMKDRKHRFFFANKAMLSLFDCTTQELLGKDSRAFFPAETVKKMHATDRRVFSGETTQEEVEVVSDTGERTVFLEVKTPLQDEADENTIGLCGISTDITTRKEMEEQLGEAKRLAESANQAKSMFLANMSHELRTPLNAILGFSQLMEQDKQLDEDQSETVQIINRSGHHLLQLINDILDMSKIEAGKTQLAIENISLEQMLVEVVDMMHLRAEQKGLQLLLDKPEDFPRYVKADGPKLRQILINLLGNAIKFTDTGGVDLRLNAQLKEDGESIILSGEMQDTGRGIDKADLERIFVPFEQLDEASEQKGTGLGLAITRQFIELMDGHITANSWLNNGTTFYFDIIVKVADEEQVKPVTKAMQSQVIGIQEPSQEWRILIAEDQPDSQLLLQQLLEPIGFGVRIAGNGEEAVEQFQEWRPHFIWMDRRMPKMNGVEATRRIKQLPGGDQVIIAALTASVFEEEKDEVIAAGCDDFVRKPFRAAEIFDCMALHLGLQYLYDEPKESAPSDVISKEKFDALPQPLQDELRHVTTLLEIDATERVVEKIAYHDKALAAGLKRLLKYYDFAAIQQLYSAGDE